MRDPAAAAALDPEGEAMTTAAVADRPSEPVLEVNGLHIDRIREDRTDTIVSSIDLTVALGETIGIVGESGSGKSMTARAITGLLPPTLVAKGEVRYHGRNLLKLKEREWRSIRGQEIGLILQDPFTMLNPVFRCGRIIEESLLPRDGHKLRKKEKRAEAIRRLAEVGIHDATVVDRYPFQLSGGMRQRVAIAAALARDPKVLIADEPSTALDVTTQREILALLRRVQEARGMSLILITHDLRVAFAMCDRIHVLYAGSMAEVGTSAELEVEPLHPYTHGLLLSEPPADHRVRELFAIPGSVPTPDEVSDSCTFATRCRWAQPVCREGAPPLVEIEPGRFSACVRLPEIRAEMVALHVRAEAEVHEQPQPSESALITVRDARKIFRNGNREVAALDGVSIEVGENESVGLVGESGSGKTTLARILIGLETASEGAIVIDGIDASNWSKLTARDRRRLRGTLQIVFQDPYSSLNPMRTVGGTLSEAITTHDPAAKNVSDRVGELLHSVGLPTTYASRKPVALSGGERQRVAIARALAVKPRILICDEPVSALDMSVQAQVLNLFKALRAERGLGYLFITHDLSIVRQVTERVYVMHRGKIVEQGITDATLDNPTDSYTIKLLDSVPRSEDDWLAAKRDGDDPSAPAEDELEIEREPAV
jgi:peptide/nickel transport system ATP-binding protein